VLLGLVPWSPTSAAPGAPVLQAPNAPQQVVGLAQGATGTDVRAIQEALMQAGIPVAGGADGVFGAATRAAVVSFQSREDVSKPGSNETWHVLKEYEGRSAVSDDSLHEGPQPSLVVLCASSAGEADGLTRESSADEIDSPLVDGLGREGSDVIPAPRVGPVLGQHLAAELVELDLPRAFHSRAFEAKIEATDSGKQ
jgi:peptidoglycan hydrolase-like protein with peptidoglycan-binding domain